MKRKSVKDQLVLNLPGETIHGIEFIYNNLSNADGGLFTSNKKYGKRIKSDFISLFKNSMVDSVTVTKDNGHHATVHITYEQLLKFIKHVEKRIEVCSKLDKKTKFGEGIAISHLSPDLCFFVNYKKK